MAEANWLRHSLQLGFVEFKRRFRSVRRNRTRLLLLGTSLAIFAAMFIFSLSVLLIYGKRNVSAIAVPTNLRVGLTVLWIVPIWYFSQQVLVFHRRLRNESFILTTVSVRTAVGSLLIADFLNACIALLVPVSFVALVLMYAYLQWISLVMLALAIILFAASTTVIGYIVGFAYLHLSVRSTALERMNAGGYMQLVVRVLILFGFLSVFTSSIIPQITVPTLSEFAWLPTSWIIDLAVLGTPITGSSIVRATGIILATGVIVVVGSAVVERFATAYWYGASTITDTMASNASDSTTISPGSNALAAALSPLFIPNIVSQPTHRMAQVVLLRLRRTPRRLSFLAGPAVSFVVILLVQAAHPWRLLPTICAVAIPWLAGAAFGLNPLGDVGAVLPTLLTSISGREFTRGLMTPGIIYGVPVTVVGTFITGVVSPDSLSEVGGLIIVGIVLTVVAVVLAPAIGMRFPRFDALVIGQRGGVLPPSLTAFAIYTGFVSILGRLATFTLLKSPILDSLFTVYGVSPDLFRIGGTVGVLFIAVLIGLLSYKSVVSRFTSYTIE